MFKKWLAGHYIARLAACFLLFYVVLFQPSINRLPIIGETGPDLPAVVDTDVGIGWAIQQDENRARHSPAGEDVKVSVGRCNFDDNEYTDDELKHIAAILRNAKRELGSRNIKLIYPMTKIENVPLSTEDPEFSAMYFDPLYRFMTAPLEGLQMAARELHPGPDPADSPCLRGLRPVYDQLFIETRQLARKNNEPSVVIDVGTGTGHYTLALLSRFNITGLTDCIWNSKLYNSFLISHADRLFPDCNIGERAFFIFNGENSRDAGIPKDFAHAILAIRLHILANYPEPHHGINPQYCRAFYRSLTDGIKPGGFLLIGEHDNCLGDKAMENFMTVNFPHLQLRKKYREEPDTFYQLYQRPSSLP